jgi:hypothetical protein
MLNERSIPKMVKGPWPEPRRRNSRAVAATIIGKRPV